MLTLLLAAGPLILATDDRLGSTEPVVCRKVVGFRDYDVLEPADLTPDEKLIVYYEPTGFSTQRDAKTGEHYAHVVQDVALRRKGIERPFKQEKAFLEYEPRGKEPVGLIYLSSSFSLKDLRPGEYEIDLILRDALDDAKEPLKQTVAFRVIARPTPDEPAPR